MGAPKRVALVIGNGNYRESAWLPNPPRDARAMADKLQQLDFEVISGIDQPRNETVNILESFERKLKGAHVGLFFFSGHGVQIGGENYILPVDTKSLQEGNLSHYAFSLNDIILRMGQFAEVNLVFLDACRTNPFVRELTGNTGERERRIRSGLAEIRAGRGTFIAFSTAPNMVALDGRGNNSPFTVALLRHISTPGMSIHALMMEVTNSVAFDTGDKQQPWQHSNLRAEFFFKPPEPLTNPEALLRLRFNEAERIWITIQDSDSEAVLDEFIRNFSGTVFANLAQARLAELRSGGGKSELIDAVKLSSSRKAEPLSAFEERILKTGDVFREGNAYPEMIVISAGRFMMGSRKGGWFRRGEKGRFVSEGPRHEVVLSRPFAVGRFAVTFDEWKACADGGGCPGNPVPPDHGWGRGRRPVINVSWDDVQEYVRWLSRQTGKSYRLLSESEWELVARAGTQTPFWWGTRISTDQANYDGNTAYGGGSKGQYRQSTIAVDSFEPNPWGLYQVHGNVFEWVQDCWNESYFESPTDGSAWTTGDCSRRVIRGGAWYIQPGRLRAAERSWYGINGRDYGIGFRVARTLSQ